MMKKLIGILLIGLLGITALGFQQQASLHQTRFYLGTVVEITVYGKDTETCQRAIDAAFDEIEKTEDLMSKYKESSEVFLINRLASKEAVTVNPKVFEAITKSVDISRLSNGAFDITVGSFMDLWESLRQKDRIPTSQELGKELEVVDYKTVVLDTNKQTIKFSKAGVQADLGGIAKGYAIDKAAEVLKESGIKSALINAGGDMFALGTPPDEDYWKIGVQHPQNRDEILTVLELKNQAVATSGDYENYFVIGGRRYCHIIDPRTGEPVDGVLSTTIIAPSTTDADALSTAVFVLGLERGMELVERLERVEGIIIVQDENSPENMKIAVSSGLRSKLAFKSQQYKREW